MATINLSKLEHESAGSDARIQDNCERLAHFCNATEVIYEGDEQYMIRRGASYLRLNVQYDSIDHGWLEVGFGYTKKPKEVQAALTAVGAAYRNGNFRKEDFVFEDIDANQNAKEGGSVRSNL